MKRVFFDESGQTGTHLFDGDQPYFALASTDMPEDEASELLATVFPRRQGPELKAANLFKYAGGRRQFVELAKALGARPDQFCAAKLGKRFAVVSKMVDHLVEPLLRDLGYDFYKDGYAQRFANSVGVVTEHILARPDSDRLLSSYNAFARDPVLVKLHAFLAELEPLIPDKKHGTNPFLSLIAQGGRRIESLKDFATLEDSNDIHVTAAIECMKFWQDRSDGPFEVVHDESTHFFKRSRRWEIMTDPDVEPQTLTVGDKSIRFPIPVVSTVSAKSHENASLQICDLLAGFVSRISAPGNSAEFVGFVREAIDEGLCNLTCFPLDFGTDLAPGEPPKADGPDILDQIVHAVRRKRKRP